VYYDLAARREKTGATEVAIVRVERLYPLPVSELAAELARYPGAESVTWVQEEPANQGAWPHMQLHLAEGLPEGVRLRRVSRSASASPAAGVASVHEAEQAALVEAALGR
jgi:2-oxoglutarate dehydrogenase E1 component